MHINFMAGSHFHTQKATSRDVYTQGAPRFAYITHCV